MSTASALSAQIRAKKKKMQAEAGAVKLSGIPEDATDALVLKNNEAGEALSENVPMAGPDETSPADAPAPGDDEKANRKLKLRAKLSKMGM